MRFLALFVSMMIATPAFACSIAFDLGEQIWAGEKINPEHLTGLTCEEMRVLRNTVYARHGYDFGDPWVRAQFVEDLRYQPKEGLTDDAVDPLLTEADRANVALVVMAEQANACSEYWSTVPMEVVEVAPRSFTEVEIWRRGSIPGDGAPIEIFDATPDAVTYRAYTGAKIDGEWLEPFTCDEMELVAAAVYARYGFAFADGDVSEYFFNFPTYRPDQRVDVNVVMNNLATNRDKHTLLVVRRLQREHGCDSGPPAVFVASEDTIDCSCHEDHPPE